MKHQLLVLAALLTPCAAPALLVQAPITWDTPTTIAGDTDVSTAGTLLWAYNFTFDATTSSTVNGVTFVGAPFDADLSANLTFGNTLSILSNNTVFAGPIPPYTGLGSIYQSLLQSAVYWAGFSTNHPIDGATSGGLVTLNNLTVGQTYQVQLWVNDSRTASIDIVGRQDIANDYFGNSVTFNFNDGTTTAGGSLGQYVIGTASLTVAWRRHCTARHHRAIV